MKSKRLISLIMVAFLSFQWSSLLSEAIDAPLFDATETITTNNLIQDFAEDIASDPETSAIYSYVNDNLQQITSGTTKYNFNYNESNNISSSYIGGKLFAQYSYTGESSASSIKFGNNQLINKDYDTNGRTTTVMYDGIKAFEYDYSNHGEIGFEKDFLSSRTDKVRIIGVN